MVTKEYSEAVVEVLDILKHTRKADVDKIPKKLIDFFESVKSATYISKINHSEKLSHQNLKPKTRALIGMLYRNYWCPSEEKEEFDKILRENYRKDQEALREKYNPDNILKNKEETVVENTNLPVRIKKETLVKKIINFIKGLFKNK